MAGSLARAVGLWVLSPNLSVCEGRLLPHFHDRHGGRTERCQQPFIKIMEF